MNTVIFSLRLLDIKIHRSIIESDLWISKPADQGAIDEIVKQSLRKENLEVSSEINYRIKDNVVHAEGTARQINNASPVISYLM